MEPIFVLAWVLSVAFTLLIAAGVVTYIRRTWQLMGSHDDLREDDRVLDGIDQLQTQLYIVMERLGEIERQLAGEGAAAPRLPGDTGAGDGSGIGPAASEPPTR